MQSLHFMFGSGSLIAPLIAVPFLASTDDEDNEATIISNVTTIPMNSSFTSNQKEEEIFHPELVQLVYPYSILAICCALSATFTLLIWYHEPDTSPHPSRGFQIKHESTVQQESNEFQLTGNQKELIPSQVENQTQQQQQLNDDEEEGNPPERSSSYTRYKILTIILVMLFMHTYLGLEISFGSYLTTFVVKSGLPLTKSDGAHITTVFWATFTLFRVLTIFYIQYVDIEVNVIGSLIVILSANAFLLPFGDTSVPMLVTGVSLIGIGTSSVWACMFGYLELYFPVTSFIGSLMLISAVMGEFVFPFLISNFIDHYPRILLWVTFFCSCSTFLLFLLIMILCRVKLKRCV